MAKFKSQFYTSMYIDQTIENPALKIFSPSAQFYMIISPKMAPKPYIETLISKISKHWYWKSSNRNSSYRYIDSLNIDPALVCLLSSKPKTTIRL